MLLFNVSAGCQAFLFSKTLLWSQIGFLKFAAFLADHQMLQCHTGISRIQGNGVQTFVEHCLYRCHMLLIQYRGTPFFTLGISTPEQAKKMASVSDGAIVGSAIVKIVAKYGKECIPEVEKYVKEMKAAVEI